MPTTTSKKIKAQFNVTPSATSTSSKRTWTFNYAADEVQTSAVQALVNAMIANGALFDTPPTSAISVIIEETTQETVIPSE